MAGPFDDLIPDQPLRADIRQRESGGKYDIPATANYAYPRSNASGAYQDQPGTWRAWTRESGIGTEYATADEAPPGVQDAVNEWGLKHYGPNSSASWAASGPYRDRRTPAPHGGTFDDLIPKKAKASAFDDLIPKKGKEARPAEQPAIAKSPGGQGKPSGAQPGPMDPSIVARQKQQSPFAAEAARLDADKLKLAAAIPTKLPPAIGEAADAESQAMQSAPGASIARWLGDKIPTAKQLKNFQLSDWLSQKVGQGEEAFQGAAETVLPQRLAQDLTQYVFEFAPFQGGIGIKSPAIKTPEGAVVEGVDHASIRAKGAEGQPGFTTDKGAFVNRTEGADIAKQADQAEPGTGAQLHSEDLKPSSVGAAATSKAVMQGYQTVPPVPTKDFIRSTDDSFFRLRGAATADKAQFDRFLNKLPPEMRSSKLQEDFYKFIEGDGQLTEHEQGLYDKYIKPLKQEEEDLYGEIKKLDPGMQEAMMAFDPAYVHRMVKGKTKEIDPWMGEASAAESPVSGFRSRSAPSLQNRVYHVMESEKGTRKLVALTDRGAQMIDKGQAAPLPRYQGEATKLGDKFTTNGEKWTIKQAKTSEIEANTQTRYYKNALAGTIKNIVQLRAVARALNEIDRLKATPEWAAYSRPTGKAPSGWRSVDFPPFRGLQFEPKFANVLEDFWTYKKPALGEAMAAVNRFSIGSLFWSPVPHALNAGAHWATARGWDWVNPISIARFPMTVAKSVREVVTQGPKYQQLLREGNGLVYGSIANEKFYRTVLQKLGESVQREPAKWDPIARAMGVGPSDLVRMLYGASSRALWSVSDMMMVQRVLELERKGMSTREAIADAERHIPNYRIPPEVLGSRMFAQALKDPSLTVFSRYHYGMFKSYAELAKDLAVGSVRQKFDAMGNVFATAALISLVAPAINAGIQKLTGDKNIEMSPKGSTTIPMELFELWKGKDISNVIQNSITLAPAPKGIYEGFTNRDFFTGKPIIEPSDWQQHRFGKVAGELGEAVVQRASQPFAAIEQAAQAKQPLKVGGSQAAGALVKQGLGLRRPFKPFHSKAQDREAAKRRGLLIDLEKRAEKWLKD